MIRYLYIITSIMGILLFACDGNKSNNYPQTNQVSVVDNYFGTKIPDPYRWLEDFNATEAQEWIQKQNKLTSDYLSKIPFRKNVKQRMMDFCNYSKEMEPIKIRDKYFFYKNDGLQDHDILYYKEGINGEEIELLNPNALSKDGSLYVSMTSFSDDAKYFGYAISEVGSDWQEIFVKNVESRENLDDHLKWAKFSWISWYKDGFFYSRFPEIEQYGNSSNVMQNCKIYYHKINTPQSEDIIIYEDPANPDYGYNAAVVSSKKYLYLILSKYSLGNALYIKNLDDNFKDNQFIKLVDDFDNMFYVIDEVDDMLYVHTSRNAPKNKIIKIDLNNPDESKWEDFIPEGESVMQGVWHIGNRFIVNYMEDAHSVIKIFDENGNFLHNLDMNLIGTISGFYGNPDEDTTFYTFTSFSTPATIYKYDAVNNISTLYKEPEIAIDQKDYEVKQVFYYSKDNTKVPMFIIHKKDLKLNGSNPTILNAYGGFNVSCIPTFLPYQLVWLEQGGVIAVANVRGGGEYGEQWHDGGTKLNKQNSFDDYIAAAEYLIKEKYSSPERLVALGSSNGGLLVGAAINQRPDLFAVAIPTTPIMDMLRYHLFTVGRFWSNEFGTSRESEKMFECLYKYSPLHNIKTDVEYPAILLTTSENDERVFPAHSFKYIATMQNTSKSKKPSLIRIESGGVFSGFGKTTIESVNEMADAYSFAFYNMGITPRY